MDLQFFWLQGRKEGVEVRVEVEWKKRGLEMLAFFGGGGCGVGDFGWRREEGRVESVGEESGGWGGRGS